jgi:hypothetical protein
MIREFDFKELDSEDIDLTILRTSDKRVKSPLPQSGWALVIER